MHKLIIYIILFLCISTSNAFAQDSAMLRKHPPKQNFRDKIFFGGNVGLQFGNQTFIDVSPAVGYKFTEKISAGIGVTYQYYRFKDKYYDFETNVYGGRVFGRYHFTQNFFGHAEYEYLNLEAFDFFRRRVDVVSIFGGVGYIQRLSDNAGIMAMILYNFNESRYSPYINPIFRVGFVVGL